MLNASSEFKRLVAQNTKTLFKAAMTFRDGTEVQLGGEDAMMGSASYSDAVSSNASFDVGAAIINSFSVTLNNHDHRFDELDFTDAVIAPSIGVELPDGTVEWLSRGLYRVDQPDSYGTTIGLTSLDNMSLLERPYADVQTAYPATLRTIVLDICQACGVELANPDFANCSYVVGERPDDGAVTCLAMMAYAAQASGNWARADASGKVRLSWYDTAAFEAEDWLDGEDFDAASPYASGSDADGGDFLDYSSGDAADGGSFFDTRIARVNAYRSAAVFTDDVVITGVRVTAQDTPQGDEGEASLFGEEGYVIELSGNPLVAPGRAEEVARQVGERVVGMRFRPFEISALGNPTVEAGDPAIVVDDLQRQYVSYITSLTYRAGSYEELSCGAESPGRNRAASYSALTRAYVQARNAMKRERTARETAIAGLASDLANSSGLYETESAQDDGSVIYYLHDKPELADSQIVWKVTASAIGVSTDGGRTYPVGVDASGRAILSQIYTIGLDADYLNTGALSVRNVSGAEVFRADVETGTVTIDTPYFTLTPQGVITARSGTIGGFTIGSTALYNNAPEVTSTAEGVYVGTDGIMTSNGSERIVVANGDVLGYQGSQKVGTISPTARIEETGEDGEPTGTVWRGLHLMGDAMVIATPHLAVIDQNSQSVTAHHTRTVSHSLGGFSYASVTDDAVSLSLATLSVDFTCGMLTASSRETSRAVTVPTKSYVDTALGNLSSAVSGKASTNHTHYVSDVSGLQDALNGKASASHTHAYGDITGGPTFSLSENVLYITV